MAVEAAPHRERLLNKIAVNFPFLVSVIGLVAVYLAAPQALLSPALELKPLYYVFFLAVPYIYIIAIIIYAVQRLRHEESPDERRKHCFVGFFPLIVILGGLVEILINQQLPVFCFACTVLMLIFYLQSMERQISLDPLTGLNNRGQLLRYVAQKSNARPDGRMTFVMMLDVNDFKKINDTYGHAEGDRALILLSDTLKHVAETMAQRSFLCRYGGDEFVLILHPAIPGVVERVAETIREELRQAEEREGLPFRLTVSIGFSPLMDEPDTLQSCMQRADEALYENKRSRSAPRRRADAEIKRGQEHDEAKQEKSHGAVCRHFRGGAALHGAERGEDQHLQQHPA
jgi:diguanylate cyclase (GGDEF)-like protein